MTAKRIFQGYEEIKNGILYLKDAPSRGGNRYVLVLYPSGAIKETTLCGVVTGTKSCHFQRKSTIPGELINSQNKVAYVDLEDWEILKHDQWSWRGGYFRHQYKSKGESLHRAVWRLTGKNPPRVIDHIDGNPLNNRRSNLRAATPTLNNQNRKISKTNTSGNTGVSWCAVQLKWYSCASAGGRSKNLGYYDCLLEAFMVREKFTEKYYLATRKYKQV